MELQQPTHPLPSPTTPKRQTKQWKDLSLGQKALVIAAPTIFIFLIAIAIGSSTGSSTSSSTVSNISSNQPAQPTTAQPSQPAKPSTQSQKLTADQKQQVSADLNNGLTHYVDTWHQGEQILGTTQYADANAGLVAMDDPNSAAAKFSTWRQSSKIEQDVTTYLNAFKSADAFYNAANEPDAISSYRDDLGTLQADISTWVSDAVGWQIQTTSNATMAKDVQTINQVKSDITATLAAD